MGVGAKRGSEIRYVKYPAVLSAVYIQWILYDPKKSLERIIIRLQKSIVDRYETTNFVDANNRREKDDQCIVEYRLTAHRKNLAKKSNTLIGFVPVPPKEIRYINDNFNNIKVCQNWLAHKFFKNKEFKNEILRCQILKSYKNGDFDTTKDISKGLSLSNKERYM